MTIKNKYVNRAKISDAKFRQLIRLFVHDLEAKTIASLTGLNRNTVNRYLTLIRKRIAEFREQKSPVQGEIEVDESYFGGKRIKGKRGRGAFKKIPVFGIFKRGGKVYTEIVSDCAKATLQDILRGRVDPDSIIHSGGRPGYNGLVDPSYKKHYRVTHENDLILQQKNGVGVKPPFYYSNIPTHNSRAIYSHS